MLAAPMASAIELYDFFILQFDSRTRVRLVVLPVVLAARGVPVRFTHAQAC